MIVWICNGLFLEMAIKRPNVHTCIVRIPPWRWIVANVGVRICCRNSEGTVASWRAWCITAVIISLCCYNLLVTEDLTVSKMMMIKLEILNIFKFRMTVSKVESAIRLSIWHQVNLPTSTKGKIPTIFNIQNMSSSYWPMIDGFNHYAIIYMYWH